MVQRMSEAGVREGRAVAEEIIQALGDDVAAESRAWWQYLYVVAELGDDCVRQLVREVATVEAAGGMTTQDGSRRRTPGGVFFALAYDRLGPKRTRSVRWRADRRFQEGMLQRFIKLLTLVLPARAEPPAPVTQENARERSRERSPTPAKPARRQEAEPEASAKAAAKPARRQEPEPVEVLVVRRRPPVTSTPAPKTPGATTPSGSSTPRAGR